MSVNVEIKKVTIPTYEVGEADKNPMFLEKRVYQGSSGRVYPHPVTYSVSDEKTDKEYTAIFLENEYLQVMLLPEIGGRVQRIYDKTNGYDAVYYNHVIKPALVGLAGPWISGGIEFNWPQHHRPSTFDPVSYTVSENEDGSVTVWMGETEKMFHTKGMAGFTLYPGKAYLEIKGQLYNPTNETQTFLWWSNPAVAVNDFTRSIFPPDVHAVMDHGKRDVSEFPIAKGTYYKVDYSAGVDISRYKNIPVPTSYMAHHSDFDFVGNYDYSKEAGLLHVADHHISPGKKQWTWGNGDFGRAWDRNLTDEDGPYIELMTGVFTDNQPDFSFIAPFEEKRFVQYFMPYKGVGQVKNATKDAMLGFEVEDGKLNLRVYTSGVYENAVVTVCEGDTVIIEETHALTPDKMLELTADAKDEDNIYVTVKAADGTLIAEWEPLCEENVEIPEPAKATPLPGELETNEELFLAAQHLEQYRHATYLPDDYYLEGLRRDETDIRLNNGYGKLLYNRGRFAEAKTHFERAIKKQTLKNPNPYDSEPYFNSGLAKFALGEYDKAFDDFYKATWTTQNVSGANYMLAVISARKGAYEAAIEFCNKSLITNAHNMKCRTLKTALLRHSGKTQQAEKLCRESLEIDPMDSGSVYELSLITGDTKLFEQLMRGDAHNYIELAIIYMDAALFGDTKNILDSFTGSDLLLEYYKAYATGEICDFEKASTDYCFPNRLSDIAVLEYAIEKNSADYKAPYLLGNLLYDRRRHDEAAKLWKLSSSINPAFATPLRNLSLYSYNKCSDEKAALEYMTQAFENNPADSRVLYELDMLKKLTGSTNSERLSALEAKEELVAERDDFYTEYMSLLNATGDYEKAYSCIMNRKFHPWEGGEGKITSEYRSALISKALKAHNTGDTKLAGELLISATSYPENLGEGKLIGEKDNDIYFFLGAITGDSSYFEKAIIGDDELSSAQYYNDMPPEMYFYRAAAEKMLGNTEKSATMFARLIEYADKNIDNEIRIDYFAVSLPDFLVFDSDLNKKNRVHCMFMKLLGLIGENRLDEASEIKDEILKLDPSHRGVADYERYTKAFEMTL